MSILEEIKKEYPCYQYHAGCINIPVKGKGKNAQKELISIASRFVMQDVPSKYATISKEDLLINMGFYKEIENPDYIPLEEQLANITLENWGALLIPPILYVLDESKLTKPICNYIEEAGAIIDYEDGTIYQSTYHYNKHLKYLKYIEDLRQQKSLK